MDAPENWEEAGTVRFQWTEIGLIVLFVVILVLAGFFALYALTG